MKLRANILPLALVVTATILIGGLALGTIVLDALRRSAETDDSMVAYYAADAGIERQLYAVRKELADVGDLGTMGESFTNGSEWVASDPSRFITTDAKVFSEINEGDFQFVDLFDPDEVGAAGGVGKVDWTWTGPGGGCEVELGYSDWDVTSPSIIPEEFKIVQSIGGTGVLILDPSRAYRLRFRPRHCDITNLVIRVYPTGSSGTPVAFPGDITIASDGAFERTTQAIAVTMPRLDILSGVFSYVIFSECTLFKDPENPSPPWCP
jgi:hypothetical protein